MAAGVCRPRAEEETGDVGARGMIACVRQSRLLQALTLLDSERGRQRPHVKTRPRSSRRTACAPAMTATGEVKRRRYPRKGRSCRQLFFERAPSCRLDLEAICLSNRRQAWTYMIQQAQKARLQSRNGLPEISEWGAGAGRGRGRGRASGSALQCEQIQPHLQPIPRSAHPGRRCAGGVAGSNKCIVVVSVMYPRDVVAYGRQVARAPWERSVATFWMPDWLNRALPYYMYGNTYPVADVWVTVVYML